MIVTGSGKANGTPVQVGGLKQCYVSTYQQTRVCERGDADSYFRWGFGAGID